MTLQQYVDSADLILTSIVITGIIAVLVMAALLSITSIAICIYFHATEYLQSRFGVKSK